MELVHVTRGALLVYIYSHPSRSCNNTDDSKNYEVDRASYLAATVYATVSLLRCIEYIPIFLALWHYLLHSQSSYSKQLCKHCFIWFILLTPILALCLAIPAVGIALEVHCGDTNSSTHTFIAYCCVNFLRYAWAFSVRFGMVFATLKVIKIWKNASESISESSASDHTAEALHARLTDEYTRAGEEVQEITKIFETWFLFPWIAFFLASSLDAKNILSPWNERKKEVEALPLVYFTLYNINQVIFLIIAYVCAKKMNHSHHQFVEGIQKRQLNPNRGQKYLAEQRKMLIQVEEIYDFVPRVWLLGFKAKMNSFIYVILLLMGLFFTISTPVI